MAKSLDFIKARVQAYKKTLEGRTVKEKNGSVSIQIAEQFNGFLEVIEKESPEAASHLPQPIYYDPLYASGPAGVNFLELEMMLNEILAVLDVIRGDH